VQGAVSAVRGIVERVALSMQGIREAVAVVSVHDMRKDSAAAPMQVELKITLADRTNLNAITEELTQNVRRNLQDVLGISDIPVIIRVAEISNAAQSKRSIS